MSIGEFLAIITYGAAIFFAASAFVNYMSKNNNQKDENS